MEPRDQEPPAQPEQRVNEQAPEDYHVWYYSREVWNKTQFLGVPCLKSVSDMWSYQEIVYELKPSLIVEFGTWLGGSALFFLDVLKHVTPRPKVLTIDITRDRIEQRVLDDPDIEVFTASSTDPSVYARIQALRDEYPGPMFAILDSDHAKDHVLAEMKLLRHHLQSGDYVLVKDGNINAPPIMPGWGPGPTEALVEYAKEYPDDFAQDTERETKFGFTFAPKGFLIRR